MVEIIKQGGAIEVEHVGTWIDLKENGSAHYKTGSVEPIDLYRAAGAFETFALCSIIKYAFRNLRGSAVSHADMDKVIDYARKIKAVCEQE